MSSETSISSASEPLQPWQLFMLAGLLGATVVVFVSRGQTPAGIVLLSLTVFAAAVIGLAAWRTIGPLAGADDISSAQILGGRTRAALEREKTLVLRSIKELEFDRAMGKLSEKDFTEMGVRLRQRAAGLLRQLDAGTTYRDEITREIERRVGASAGSAARHPAYTAASAGSAARHPAYTAAGSAPRHPAYTAAGSAPRHPAYAADATKACSHCGTVNDVDAKFCKSCGANLETSE